jgi:hypothetical protein
MERDEHDLLEDLARYIVDDDPEFRLAAAIHELQVRVKIRCEMFAYAPEVRNGK